MALKSADFISRDWLTHSENYHSSFLGPGQGFKPAVGHGVRLNFVAQARHVR